MTLEATMALLQAKGNAQTKKTLLRHGAKEPLFGVKIGDLKKILRETGRDHSLALELYQTGNSDAMYLAALMADEKQILQSELQAWAEDAYWYYLSEYAVPWLASEHTSWRR